MLFISHMAKDWIHINHEVHFLVDSSQSTDLQLVLLLRMMLDHLFSNLTKVKSFLLWKSQHTYFMDRPRRSQFMLELSNLLKMGILIMKGCS